MLLTDMVPSFVVLVIKEFLLILHKANTNNMISIAMMMLKMMKTPTKAEIVMEHVPQFGRSSGDSTIIGVEVVVMTNVGVEATD